MNALKNTASPSVSRMAPAFIGLMGIGALAIIVDGMLRMGRPHYLEFLTLLLLGALTSRLKLKLPGLTGNMSVNLPFIFIAMTRLGLVEVLVVAGASILTQSLPNRGEQFRSDRVLFNVSTALVAAGLGCELFNRLSAAPSDWSHKAFALVFACATYFLVNTFAVAIIIALTEHLNPLRTWSNIVHLSFPNYLGSAGLASMVALGHTSWPVLAAILSVIFLTYRSYRLYFGLANTALPAPTGSDLLQSTRQRSVAAAS